MKSKVLLALIIIIVIAFIVGIIFAVTTASKRIEENLEPEEPTKVETIWSIMGTESTPDQVPYPYADKNALDYGKNKDMIGWLTVDGTTIDYPVMQSPDYPDYYLVRDFFKKPSTYGCPYVQSNCNLKKPSDNIIIYSHYMKDGTMFAELEKYKDSDYYKKHKTITFEIDGRMNDYEVMAVIAQTFTTEDDKTFKFYEFVDAFDPHSFNQFVSQAKSMSLFDTDIDAQPGDKLLTLATSEYNENGERFIIVAKRK